jgi:hypothetical protein
LRRYNKYVDLLANDGTIVLVGLVSKPLVLNYTSLAGPMLPVLPNHCVPDSLLLCL